MPISGIRPLIGGGIHRYSFHSTISTGREIGIDLARRLTSKLEEKILALKETNPNFSAKAIKVWLETRENLRLRLGDIRRTLKKHGLLTPASNNETECMECKERLYICSNGETSLGKKKVMSVDEAKIEVPAHEREHARIARDRLKKQGKEIVSINTSVKQEVCPRCGRVYISGGKTVVKTKDESIKIKPIKSLDCDLNLNSEEENVQRLEGLGENIDVISADQFDFASLFNLLNSENHPQLSDLKKEGIGRNIDRLGI